MIIAAFRNNPRIAKETDKSFSFPFDAGQSLGT